MRKADAAESECRWLHRESSNSSVAVDVDPTTHTQQSLTFSQFEQRMKSSKKEEKEIAKPYNNILLHVPTNKTAGLLSRILARLLHRNRIRTWNDDVAACPLHELGMRISHPSRQTTSDRTNTSAAAARSLNVSINSSVLQPWYIHTERSVNITNLRRNVDRSLAPEPIKLRQTPRPESL